MPNSKFYVFLLSTLPLPDSCLMKIDYEYYAVERYGSAVDSYIKKREQIKNKKINKEVQIRTFGTVNCKTDHILNSRHTNSVPRGR